MRVLGIDQSLTGTGLAIVENGRFGALEVIKPKTKGYTRVAQIVSRCLDLAADCDIVAVEHPALSMRGSASTGALFGLFGVLTQSLWAAGKEPVIINVTHRALYATGKGNANKDAVMMSVARRYSDDRLVDNNIIDAAIIAAMVARIVGEPLLDEAGSLPEVNAAVLTKVVMPGQYEDLVATELVEARAWRSVAARATKPQFEILRALADASPEYAHALIDYALERGYEVYGSQRWVTCTRRLDQPNHTCGASKCSTEWATPADWERPVLLRQINGDEWAILTQCESDHGLPAPAGGTLRAHLHTANIDAQSAVEVSA